MQSLRQWLLTTWIGRYFSARHQIWRELHNVQPHPISRHIQRQLYKQHQLPILAITFLWGSIVWMGMIIAFSRVGTTLIILLPLYLMIFSGSYILPWLYRIATIIKQQHRDAVLDVIGVIPPGRVYVTFAIAHAVFNEEDRLGWLRLLRQIVLLIAIVGIFFATILTISQIETDGLTNGLPILLDMIVISLLIYLEHHQSILIGCYLAVIIPQQASHHGNIVGNILINYSMLQFLTWMIPVVIVILGESINALSTSSFTIIGFILVRELLLVFLWYRADTTYDR